MACPAYPRAIRAHVPYVPYVLTRPTSPTSPTCPRVLCALCAHVPKYVLQTGKLKISVLMKPNEGSITDVFKGTEF